MRSRRRVSGRKLPGMYQSDSFFTLSGAGQIGLVAVSIAFALIVAGIVRFLARGRPWALRIAIWAALFFVFVWLSPQGYYAYYRLIFDDLPRQWVIQAPPRPAELAALLTFSVRASLSFHSQGVLGWALLLVALWPYRRKMPQRSGLTPP
ncbi:hypothetical protein V8J82_10625 [Gymnodinialimonas sp. 2305UL16-5]|uniref:hypothetical protein n=1 Tax=Gymnodinialimonas mytili TaxID=3126503 RepID=UPI0030A7799E